MMRNLSLTACRNNRLTALLMALAALGIGTTAVSGNASAFYFWKFFC